MVRLAEAEVAVEVAQIAAVNRTEVPPAAVSNDKALRTLGRIRSAFAANKRVTLREIARALLQRIQ